MPKQIKRTKQKQDKNKQKQPPNKPNTKQNHNNRPKKKTNGKAAYTGEAQQASPFCIGFQGSKTRTSKSTF
jgi:hypothetical protein